MLTSALYLMSFWARKSILSKRGQENLTMKKSNSYKNDLQQQQIENSSAKQMNNNNNYNNNNINNVDGKYLNVPSSLNK